MGLLIDASVLIALERGGVDLALRRGGAAGSAGAAFGDHCERGTPIGAHDMWLAAQALAGGHAVVTTNAREFARVPGLEVEVWA